jgi:hypothetical protein
MKHVKRTGERKKDGKEYRILVGEFPRKGALGRM